MSIATLYSCDDDSGGGEGEKSDTPALHCGTLTSLGAHSNRAYSWRTHRYRRPSNRTLSDRTHRYRRPSNRTHSNRTYIDIFTVHIVTVDIATVAIVSVCIATVRIVTVHIIIIITFTTVSSGQKTFIYTMLVASIRLKYMGTDAMSRPTPWDYDMSWECA